MGIGTFMEVVVAVEVELVLCIWSASPTVLDRPRLKRLNGDFADILRGLVGVVVTTGRDSATGVG